MEAIVHLRLIVLWRRANRQRMRILRRNIRDMSNPFEIPEIAFQTLFRVSRILARDLCGLLRGRLQRTMTSGIPVHIQVTAALRFFAEGGYQRGVGQDSFVALSQPSTGRCIHNVCKAVSDLLADRWIVFPTTAAQRERVQQGANRQRMRILRRNIRDMNNPFEIPEIAFQTLFRVSRILARDLCGLLRGMLQRTMTSGIPVHIQVTVALRFFAEGGYQRGVGQDSFVALSQTSTGRCIHNVCNAVSDLLADRWIVFPTTAAQRERVQQGYEIIKYDMLQICYRDLRALNVNARFPGRVHDQFIWRDSAVKVEMKRLHQERIGDFYLLGIIPFDEEAIVPEPHVPAAIENNVANDANVGREVRADIVRRYFYR
uniref:Uncharacterized protein n=1 Tax=Timema tahoe TaxID=61484 RepID=A0A7R9FME6_9NEOP|nr:unnamed protein product [Timema tahoe]